MYRQKSKPVLFFFMFPSFQQLQIFLMIIKKKEATEGQITVS